MALGEKYVVSQYSFEEGSGTTASDSTRQYDGVITGATYVAGKVGRYSLSFNGTSDYVDLATLLPYLEHNGSITMWINPQGAGVADAGGTITIFQSNLDFRTRLFYSNTGFIRVVKGNPGISSANYTVTDGTWYHVAITWEAGNSTGTCKFYVNGVLIDTITYGDITTTATNCYLATFNKVNPLGGWWKGYIDEVKVWKGVMTLSDVVGDYNGGAGTPYVAKRNEIGLLDQLAGRAGKTSAGLAMVQ